MAKRVSKYEIGETLVGRVLFFDRMKGYGFIRTSTGEDIFLSSYYVSKSFWKRISVGDYVQFVVGKNEHNPNNPVLATEVTITRKMPRRLCITMPNHERLEVKCIYQFGKKSLIDDGYKEPYPDYPDESFDYVFIKTPERTFVFNQYGSPVIIDGEADVDEFYQYLTDTLVKYDIDQTFESF